MWIPYRLFRYASKYGFVKNGLDFIMLLCYNDINHMISDYQYAQRNGENICPKN